MAVDELLLRETAEHGTSSLRIYGWKEPTLSLGYFQPIAARAGHPASLACPVVRRRSGGGALVHDREITYCLTLPARHVTGRMAEMDGQVPSWPTCQGTNPSWVELYQRVHGAWIDAVQHVAPCNLRLFGKSGPARSSPFLCFERRSCSDVVLDHVKVLGSAQRRQGAALLQHGSLLLARSTCAPELPGLENLLNATISQPDLIAAWQRALARTLHLELFPSPLAERERARIDYLRSEIFAAEHFTQRR